MITSNRPDDSGHPPAAGTPPAATSGPAAGPVLTTAAARMVAAEVARLRGLIDADFAKRRREALSVAQDEDAHLAIEEDEIVVRARLAGLEYLLRSATVVDHEPAGPDMVGIGSRVTLEDETSGRTSAYEVVAWHDGATTGTVSAASPVGQAILGHAAGELVTIALPGGRTRRLRIAAVDQPAATLL